MKNQLFWSCEGRPRVGTQVPVIPQRDLEAWGVCENGLQHSEIGQHLQEVISERKQAGFRTGNVPMSLVFTDC